MRIKCHFAIFMPVLAAVAGIVFSMEAVAGASARADHAPATTNSQAVFSVNSVITSTSTISPSLQSITVTTSSLANAYAGPGDDYEFMVAFAPGLTFDAIGRSADNNWAVIPLSKWQNAWIAVDKLVANQALDLLPIHESKDISDQNATSDPQPRPVISVLVNSGQSLVAFSVSGLTPGRYYTIRVESSTGKIVLKSGGNALTDGFINNRYGHPQFHMFDLKPDTYTIIVYSDEMPIGSKQFTVSKKK
jgi:hypothetical protein